MLAQTKRVHAQKGRKRKMLNFAVGPVQGDPEILNIGAEQVPYFSDCGVLGSYERK